MKLIIKQKEPTYLRNHRLIKNTNYESFCRDIGLGNIQPSTGFRQYLLEEHGYLCVYCMRQIPHKHIEKTIEHDDMKIEHHTSQKKPKSISTKLDITYSNIFACCMGNKGRLKKFQTCDTRKGDEPITINPTNKLHIETIKYGFDGLISSNNEVFDEEINKILNLNENNLKKQREVIYKLVDKRTKIAFKTLMDRTSKNDYLTKEIDIWLKAKNHKYKEYCMVAVVYLQNRLR